MYLLASVPGQATQHFGLILSLFVGLRELPDTPKMKWPSWNTTFSLVGHPSLCRLLCLWRFPRGLIWWCIFRLLLLSGKVYSNDRYWNATNKGSFISPVASFKNHQTPISCTHTLKKGIKPMKSTYQPLQSVVKTYCSLICLPTIKFLFSFGHSVNTGSTLLETGL